MPATCRCGTAVRARALAGDEVAVSATGLQCSRDLDLVAEVFRIHRSCNHGASDHRTVAVRATVRVA
jgi:hypothetical protein